MRFALLSTLISIAPIKALAQADFTRQFLSSGHYEVKKIAPAGKKRKPASETEVKAEAKATAQADGATKVEIVLPPAPVIEAPPAVPAPEQHSSEVAEPAIADQVKSLLSSDDKDDVIVRYEERVHPEDHRLNRLEIEGRAGLSASDSSSNYSYRRYNTSFGTVDLRSSVWMAPSVGLTGAIKFSLGASVRGDATTGSMDRLRDEELEVGLRFRRFFGLSRVSPSLEFGLLYLDHSFNLANDSTSHPRWDSSGVGVGLRSRVPVSAERSWVFGGRIFPRMKHQESKTAVAVTSGDPGEFARVDFEVGGDLTFGRGQQFVYGLQFGAERDLFDGAASLADPETSATPSNVTVTNTLLNFSFGYRWGR